MLERLSKFLFGYDIFISYSYSDGKPYAHALEKGLTARDFSCFLDKNEMSAGGSLTTSLLRAIRRSRVIVLVGTETVLHARYVNLELSTALDTRGKQVIPIDVDGVRERMPERAQGLIWLDEEPAAKTTRSPSSTVLDGIANHFRFTRRNTLTRRVVEAFGVLMFLVASVAVWQWRVAVQQERIAIQERDLALSRQLAAQSKAVVSQEPDLALLLAARAATVNENFETRDALLGALRSRPGLVALLHDAGQVRRLAFSPDGRALVSLSSANEISLWDMASHRLRTPRFSTGGRIASGLSFSRDGRLLAAAFDAQDVMVWDLESRAPGRAATAAEIEEFAFANDPEGYSLGGHEDAISRFAQLQKIADIRVAALSPDAQVLATAEMASADVRLWRVSDGKQLGVSRSAQKPFVRALAFAPDGLLASGSSAGTIALWRLSELPAFTRPLSGLSVSANTVAFSADGKRLASGDYASNVMHWSVADRAPGKRLTHPAQSGRALRFSTDGRQLVSSGSALVRWNLDTGEAIGAPLVLPEHSAAAISPDLKTVALGSNDGDVFFVSTNDGVVQRPTSKMQHDRILALAFSPDGGLLASAGNGRSIVLWDVVSRAASGPPLEAHTTAVGSLSFNADGSRLASYDSNGTLLIWDVTTRKRVGRSLQRENTYRATAVMALSPDGRTAATTEKDGPVVLWDVATWRMIDRPIAAHMGDVIDATYSPSGEYLATGSLGGQVILWDLRAQSWIQLARTMANRDFTADEQEIYLGVAPDR